MKVRIAPVTNKSLQLKFLIQLLNDSGDIYDSHDIYLSYAELVNLKLAIDEVLDAKSVVYNQL